MFLHASCRNTGQACWQSWTLAFLTVFTFTFLINLWSPMAVNMFWYEWSQICDTLGGHKLVFTCWRMKALHGTTQAVAFQPLATWKQTNKQTLWGRFQNSPLPVTLLGFQLFSWRKQASFYVGDSVLANGEWMVYTNISYISDFCLTHKNFTFHTISEVISESQPDMKKDFGLLVSLSDFLVPAEVWVTASLSC